MAGSSKGRRAVEREAGNGLQQRACLQNLRNTSKPRYDEKLSEPVTPRAGGPRVVQRRENSTINAKNNAT